MSIDFSSPILFLLTYDIYLVSFSYCGRHITDAARYDDEYSVADYLISNRTQRQCTKNDSLINPVKPVTPSKTLHHDVVEQGGIKYCPGNHDLADVPAQKQKVTFHMFLSTNLYLAVIFSSSNERWSWTEVMIPSQNWRN